MTIPKIFQKECTSKQHYADERLFVLGYQVLSCPCEKVCLSDHEDEDIQIVKCNWLPKTDLVEYIVLEHKPTVETITDRQLYAIAKRQIGIPLNSTERNHLMRFRKKLEKAGKQYYEMKKYEI